MDLTVKYNFSLTFHSEYYCIGNESKVSCRSPSKAMILTLLVKAIEAQDWP